MYILSIDVGIKNLAYCLFHLKSETEYCIAKWNIIDLVSDQKMNCGVIKKNGERCQYQAKYCKNNEYYCKKHAKASFVGLYLTQKEGQVFLKIADNGQGISKESAGESRFLTGLGVQSIKLRVEEMNGEFSIKNGKLGGVEISITIPGRETEEI